MSLLVEQSCHLQRQERFKQGHETKAVRESARPEIPGVLLGW